MWCWGVSSCANFISIRSKAHNHNDWSSFEPQKNMFDLSKALIFSISIFVRKQQINFLQDYSLQNFSEISKLKNYFADEWEIIWKSVQLMSKKNLPMHASIQEYSKFCARKVKLKKIEHNLLEKNKRNEFIRNLFLFSNIRRKFGNFVAWQFIFWKWIQAFSVS